MKKKRILWLFLLSFLCVIGLQAQTRKVKLVLVETSDVHGNYFPYDFINNRLGRGSMARISAYMKQLRHGRRERGKGIVLLDNGDILQGQPSAYYYNYIDTISTHLTADVLNYMKYDAATVGNHDVETGHSVYDRWAKQCKFPMLGANVISVSDNQPYWKPYTIIERQGVKIAVLGMITPCIPKWLPRNLWAGLKFADLMATARKYMPEMQRKADVVVGLFHSGVGNPDAYAEGCEDGALAVAREVPGFDVVFCGHDHRRACQQVVNTVGDTVWVLNPAAQAEAVAKANIVVTFKGRKVIKKHTIGSIVDINNIAPDTSFIHHFSVQYERIKAFTSKVIGYNQHAMQSIPALFGSSAFIDFIHQMQLSISGADISFAAPLALDAKVPQGEVRVSDMFNLYRYENQLYVVKLTGREVKDYLEYSYSLWVNQMHSASDHLLLFRSDAETLSNPWQRLQNPCYNFDSAMGICYTVDVTKPVGQRVNITHMADGTPFDFNHTYRCALSSYRGNGGGDLLTKGAGISINDLPGRIVWSTEKDLRYYLIMGIERQGTINPRPQYTWKFIPEEWVDAARKKDELLLK